MNAQTYPQAVNPVLAVLATPKYKRQPDRQSKAKRTKKRKSFDSLYEAACDTDNNLLVLYTVGCYGKDAKPVVGNVSSFDRTL